MHTVAVAKHPFGLEESEVQWTVEGPITAVYGAPASQAALFGRSAGSVRFGVRQSEAAIELQLQNDGVPALDRQFRLTLSDATGPAAIVPPGTHILTVAASNHPFGLFSFFQDCASECSSIVRVPEGAETPIAVHRLGGALGEALVTVQVATGQGAGLPPGDVRVAASSDFEQVAPMVLAFADGERVKTFGFTAVEDVEPELDEVFSLLILDVTSTYEYAGAADPDHLIAIAGSGVATGVITENDDARGVIAFVQSEATVTEDQGAVQLLLTRTGGLLASVAVN